MSTYADVRAVFARFPEAFNESATLAQFAERTGRLSTYVGGWADNLFLTDKAHGIGTVSGPLAFPYARTFRDLFKLARYAPAYSGPGNIHTGTPRNVIPGHYPVFPRFTGREELVVPIGDVGGRRGIREFPDGTIVRQHNASQFFITHGMPRPEVLDDWSRVIGPVTGDDFSSLSSFDVIKRADGVLVIARARGADRWLAFLSPDASIVPMLPQEDRDLLDREKAAEEAAWGGIIKGPDGREYIDPAKVPTT